MTRGDGMLLCDVQAPEGQIVSSLLGFVGLLRSNGFLIGVQESQDVLRFAARAEVLDKDRLRVGLRALLCSQARDWHRYDALFDAFWHRPNRTTAVSTSGASARAPLDLSGTTRASGGRALEVDAAHEGSGDAVPPEGTQKGASAREGQLQGDFRFITEARAMREMEELVEQVARRMRRRLVRRQRLAQRGRRIHLRRTLRKSLAHGGLPLELVFHRRRRELPRLVLLLDVSRSMSLYSFLLLRFARGLLGVFDEAEAFVFHTHLVHVTEALKTRELNRLRETLAMLSLGWGGGTRIGESLQVFNRQYAGRLLNARTVVIVMSDGFDTGEPAVLGEALRRIRSRSSKVMWLNPLLGREGYEPLAGGMQAALPFVDRFLPAHDLQSLQALEREWVGL